MPDFVKNNVFPIIISALIGLSAYMVERVVTHSMALEALRTEQAAIRKELETLRDRITEIYKHLDTKIDRRLK